MNKSAPPDALWRFDLCPKSQLTACYIYEYSLECETVKAEVESWREAIRRKRASSIKKRQSEWLRNHPFPYNEIVNPGSEFESPAERIHKIEEIIHTWWEKYCAAAPNSITDSNLSTEQHFLPDCKGFPAEHWLEISLSERAQIVTRVSEFSEERMRTQATPGGRANAPLFITSFRDFMSGFSLERNKELRGFEGYYVISFNWERGMVALSKDFREWLSSHPERKPPLKVANPNISRATTPKEHLKNLSVLRLLRCFSNDWNAAADYSQKVLTKPLYQEQSSWIKAANKARLTIRRFDKASR